MGKVEWETSKYSENCSNNLKSEFWSFEANVSIVWLGLDS